MSETQDVCGEASQAFLRALGSSSASESLGLGLPQHAPGWLLLAGCRGKAWAGLHRGDSAGSRPGMSQERPVRAMKALCALRVWQSLIFLCFYGRDVTKASGQWFCGPLEMGSETIGEGCLYVSGDTRFPPAASKGLEQKKPRRAKGIRGGNVNVQSSFFRRGYSVNRWKKSCPLITGSFGWWHSAHRSDNFFLLYHSDKRKIFL